MNPDERSRRHLIEQAEKICRRNRVFGRIKDRGLEFDEVCAQAVYVFLLAVSKGNYQPTQHSVSSQEAYLTGIVEHVIHDLTKRKMTRLKHEKANGQVEELARIDHTMELEVADVVGHEEAIERLLAEVGSPIDKMIIIQYLQFRKPSLRKVADKLGMAPATVRQRFKRLRQKVLAAYESLQSLMMK